MWTLTVLFACSAVLQLAVHIAPDIHDSPLRSKARRIKIAALALLCAYFSWAAATGHRDHPWLLVALLLACLADLIFATDRLFPASSNPRRSAKGPDCE